MTSAGFVLFFLIFVVGGMHLFVCSSMSSDANDASFKAGTQSTHLVILLASIGAIIYPSSGAHGGSDGGSRRSGTTRIDPSAARRSPWLSRC
jgi:hypothetical protein